MGKSNKFVPPLKSPQSFNIDKIGNNIKKNVIKLSKTNNKKKLIVNFDYAKMKKKHANVSKKQLDDTHWVTQEDSEIIEITPDESLTSKHNDVTSGEFMWFQPIQASSKVSAQDPPTTEGTCSETVNSQQHGEQLNVSIEGYSQVNDDVYKFPSSPGGLEQRDPACVACHLEEAEEKMGVKKRKKTVKKNGDKSRRSSKQHIKKKVKKQVLKSLLKMGKDMAMLRPKEKALQHGEMALH